MGGFVPLLALRHRLVVTDEAMRRTADPMEKADDIPDPDASPESLALAATDHHMLWDAVARLPDVQRQAIELRIAGLTGREIATEIGRSPDAVNWSDIGPDGTLWVTDNGNNRVQQFAPDGTFLQSIGSFGDGEG